METISISIQDIQESYNNDIKKTYSTKMNIQHNREKNNSIFDYIHSNRYSYRYSYIIQKCKKYLQNGGIVIFPTDTVYGLLCSFQKESILKLHEIKKRSIKKPFLLNIAENDTYWKFIEWDNYLPQYRLRIENLIKKNWPGKNTIIFYKRTTIFYPFSDTIALRMSSKKDNALFYALINDMQTPIVSTSLNISGREPLEDPDMIKNIFHSNISLFIEDTTYRLQNKKESKIYDTTLDSMPRIR